jgi:formate dehydrogenase major subunit
MSLTETASPPTTSGHSDPSTIDISVDGHTIAANEGELVVEAISAKKELPHICYHSALMGRTQTCDTCLVEVDGKLVRSCGVKVSSGMQVVTDSKRATDACAEALDTILGDHMLYCTACDNNNENCRVHNTALELNVQHQEHPGNRATHSAYLQQFVQLN